jgi:hypothetical protein
VSSDTFAELAERYAVKDWAHRARLQQEASPKGYLTPEQQREAQRASTAARNADSMVSLRKLQLAVASYRTVLVARGSEHTPELYEQEVILVAMLSDGVQPLDAVQGKACELTSPPKDCEGAQCGAWSHLEQVARTLCEDPMAYVPKADPDAHVLGRPSPP